MTSATEFFVEAIAEDRAGRTVHVGFVVTGGPLRVGDEFVSTYELPRALEDVQLGRVRPAPVNLRSIAVRVDGIDVCRKPALSLPDGVTGALYLAGEDVSFIGIRTCLLTSR